MKLPSLSRTVADARDTFVRFPLVILDAVIGTVCMVMLIDHQGHYGPTVLNPIMFGAVLGFPLLAALAIVSEKWKWGRPASLGAQCAGVLLAGVYALSVPRDLAGAPSMHILRLLMLTAGMVLVIFTLPYLRHESEHGYWNYCKTLLLRTLTAGLYAVVLFAGLAIALAALDNLFGVHVPEMRYPELWVCINGIFTTWFILAGVPKDLERLDAETGYPKGLRIFSQYILFPLVLVYVVILYAYLAKILFAWEWPQGWVSGLILGFIATGFASLLLLHPVRDLAGNVWINKAARWFYWIIIPLIVMLFLAVWRRVSEYGLTEGRYLGLAAVVWLCAVTPYFLFSRKKKILFLTTSLCIAVFAVSLGPWGMFASSERSQVGRLERLLAGQRILVDGRIESRHDTLQFEATKHVSSILAYLGEVHGYDAIQPWFGESLKQDASGRGDAYKHPALVAKLMGVEFVRRWQTSAEGPLFLKADAAQAMEIGEYDRLLNRQSFFKGGANREYAYRDMTLRVDQDLQGVTLTTAASGARGADSVRIDLQPLVKKLAAAYANAATDHIAPEEMSITAANRTMKMKVFIFSMTIQRREGTTEVTSLEPEIAYTLIHESNLTED
ncbi:MAG: DUF4153 domain-containing protein [Acidobacteriota bacterium]